MYVTKDKNLTTDEIRKLSDEELKEIYRARIEDWFIKPMEILDGHEHTGFAIAHLLQQITVLVPGAFNEVQPLFAETDLLHHEYIGVDGNPENVFTRHHSHVLIFNPHKAVAWARNTLEGLVTNLDTYAFRFFLVKKSKLIGE